MVFLALEDRAAVEPDLPGVLGAEPDLGGAILRRDKLGNGVGDHPLEPLLGALGRFGVGRRRRGRVGEIDVHDPVLVAGLDRLPRHLPLLAVERGRQIEPLLRRIDGGKSLPLGVVKGPDDLPVAEEAEVACQVDGATEIPDSGRERLDLLDIPRGREGLLVSGEGLLLLLCRLQRLSPGDDLRHRIAPQFDARILHHPVEELVGPVGVGSLDEIEGQTAGARIVLRLAEEADEAVDGQLGIPPALRDDRIDRSPQPVGRQRIGAVHPREDVGKRRRIGRRNHPPGLRGRGVPLPLVIDREDRREAVGHRRGDGDSTANDETHADEHRGDRAAAGQERLERDHAEHSGKGNGSGNRRATRLSIRSSLAPRPRRRSTAGCRPADSRGSPHTPATRRRSWGSSSARAPPSRPARRDAPCRGSPPW